VNFRALREPDRHGPVALRARTNILLRSWPPRRSPAGFCARERAKWVADNLQNTVLINVVLASST